ncbi:UPF0179 family protein [Candidatus Bathyarchaeota archaeon]|nr:UPF0179 family protein [Candidatus Bathyarchaeota archaeon]
MMLKKVSRRPRTTRRKVTVLGRIQARMGYRFRFHGVPEACLGCGYKGACLEGLEEDRIYTVKQVLDKMLPCVLRMGDGVLVEVEEEPISLLVRVEAAIPGALLTYEGLDCPGSCENYELCHPQGLRMGDRCLIVEVKEVTRCPEGLNLALVTVQRRPQPS